MVSIDSVRGHRSDSSRTNSRMEFTFRGLGVAHEWHPQTGQTLSPGGVEKSTASDAPQTSHRSGSPSGVRDEGSMVFNSGN